MKRPRQRVWFSRLVGIGLVVLVPGQALAHCGILLPDRHERQHHASATPASHEHGDPGAQLGPGQGDVACTPGEAVFIASRAPEQMQAALMAAPLGTSSLERPAMLADERLSAPDEPHLNRPVPLSIPLRI